MSSQDSGVELATVAGRKARRPRHSASQEASASRRDKARAEIEGMLRELGLWGLPPGAVAQQIRKSTFKEHGLYSLIQHSFNGSPYAALKEVYPDLEPWQMGHVPMTYWMGKKGHEHARQATRWLIAQMGLASVPWRDVAQRVDFYSFGQYGLRGMLDRVYGGSPYAALRDVYPALEAWDRDTVPRDFWRGEQGRENARRATRRMLEESGLVNLALEELAREVTQHTFAEHGLSGMLSNVYMSSPYEALRDLYPQLRPWQMTRVPLRYWNGAEGREHAREAMQWLMDRLELSTNASYEELQTSLTRHAFREAGLSGMLQTVYNSRISQGIDEVLSGLGAGPEK